MKIAHFSPLPPQRSGIASYCSQLIPYLNRHMSVDAYTSSENGGSEALSFEVRSIADFWNNNGLRYQYDLCLYHMGNHPLYHDSIYRALLRYPGITVLHDLNMHAFFLQRISDGNSGASYIREMGYAHGISGVLEAIRTFSGGVAPRVDERPLFERVVDSSLGVIVHTEQARLRVQAALPGAAVARLSLAAAMPDADILRQRPAELKSIPTDAVVLASFGYLAPSKRIDVILRALAQLRSSAPPFHYLLIGQPIPDYDLAPLIKELELDDIVHMADFVNDRAFEALLGWIDIGLNLRTGPTGGEMSATLVRLLANGRSVLVSDVGGFSEFPNEAVLKIKQDEQEIGQLVSTLRHLITDSNARRTYGRSAKAYAVSHLAFSTVARQYVAFIEERLAALSFRR